MSLPHQDLQIDNRITAGCITVAIRGEIDLATASEFRHAVTDHLLDGSVTSVHLDLSQVTFMDSSGVHAMLAAQRASRSLGGQMILTRSSPQVDRLLALMGLGCMFAVTDGDQPGDDGARVIDMAAWHQSGEDQQSHPPDVISR